jgi:hypothetical protein
VDDDDVGADLVGQLQTAVDLVPRIGAPDALGDEQGRRVDRDDRQLVVLRERSQRTGLLVTGSDQTMTSTAS